MLPDMDAGFASREVRVAGSSMRYLESGRGRPVLFLHGNPTSSHLWRNVLPHLIASERRLIAVDLIGMGQSGKPDIGYRLHEHIDYVIAFINELSLTAMSRTLTPGELAVYRRPYPDPASRRPLLQWAREIPIAGQPADVAQILERSWEHLARSDIRKLLVHGQPGAIINAQTVAWCRQTQPGLAVADVGEAMHFLPEDKPRELADVLSRWL
jgi:pimeloyl-ACP methyl ester carboxylesterase